MPYQNDGLIPCKLAINNAKMRHYWQTEKGVCDCGCKVRVRLKNPTLCLEKLKEELNKLGYSVEKNYNKKDFCEVCDGLK